MSPDRFTAGRDVRLALTGIASTPDWDFTNPFAITANRDILVASDARFTNEHALVAGRNIEIRAVGITNTAGVENLRTVYATPRYPGCRTDYGGRCIADEDVERASGILSASGDITLTASQVANRGGSVLAGGNIDVGTADFFNGARILKADWTSQYFTKVLPPPPMYVPGDGSPDPAEIAPPPTPTYVPHTASGSVSNIGEIPALIRAGGRFSVAGVPQDTDPGVAPATPPVTPPETSSTPGIALKTRVVGQIDRKRKG